MLESLSQERFPRTLSVRSWKDAILHWPHQVTVLLMLECGHQNWKQFSCIWSCRMCLCFTCPTIQECGEISCLDSRGDKGKAGRREWRNGLEVGQSSGGRIQCNTQEPVRVCAWGKQQCLWQGVWAGRVLLVLYGMRQHVGKGKELGSASERHTITIYTMGRSN